VTNRDWKYIEPTRGPRFMPGPGIETGYDAQAQLYDLRTDIGEKHNVAAAHPDQVRELQAVLDTYTAAGRAKRGPPAETNNAD